MGHGDARSLYGGRLRAYRDRLLQGGYGTAPHGDIAVGVLHRGEAKEHDGGGEDADQRLFILPKTGRSSCNMNLTEQ